MDEVKLNYKEEKFKNLFQFFFRYKTCQIKFLLLKEIFLKYYNFQS